MIRKMESNNPPNPSNSTTEETETESVPEIVVANDSNEENVQPEQQVQRSPENVPEISFIPTSSSIDDIPPPKPDFYAPPPYELTQTVTKLPTYEEVQREKSLEGQNIPIPNTATPRAAQYRPPGQRILTIDNETTEDVDTTLLGTDFMFYIAFFVAFIFNWIGFLLLMCFCHTIASRYGALSGFGLSLAKWTIIVQHSTDLASKDNSWLWWLIMTFGLIICIRAILQYLSIKRGWHMLSASHQERLLFFY